MSPSKWSSVASLAFLATSLLLSHSGVIAATRPVDLDALPANAAESMCSTTVLAPFPVRIENKVTNRTNGDAFTFSWPSAGPGGFTSSVGTGNANGVGATWIWTTNESVVGFTGNSCQTDICFAKTGGAAGGFCSDSCIADATTVSVRKSGATGVELSWTGGTGTFTVYRGSTKIAVVAPTNSVGTTNTFVFTETPPANSNAFYVVRGTDCATRKPCTTNADCAPATEGTCVNRGPFSVPGRSLLANEVTVSSASLTSSLITFFSPPVEVFRATSSTNAGGVSETLTNPSGTPMTVTTAAFPPGCCPYDEGHPHQIRCGDECVDYLSDGNNCGACGNTCGDGACCVGGTCHSICPEGETFCDGECVDLHFDNDHCGTCGSACGEAACCENGECNVVCGEGEIFCGGYCISPWYDNDNCGGCGIECGSEECCNGGTCQSTCDEGWTACDFKGILCVDLNNDNNSCGGCGEYCDFGTCCQDGGCVPLECNIPPGGWELNGDLCYYTIHDNNNCGGVGNVCPVGTCCNGEGTCNPPCYAETEVECGDQCAELNNDNYNCGACGNICDDGECCNGSTCESMCAPWMDFCESEGGGYCADTYADDQNCGECGIECEGGDICCKGSCRPYYEECSEGDVPTEEPYCPNENLRDPVPIADRCPGPVEPQPATCPNPYTTEWEYSNCDVGGYAATPASPNYCDSDVAAGGFEYSCPEESPYPPPTVEEAPVCTRPESTTTIPPGGSLTTCIPGGPLFKEVASEIVVCGDGLPVGVDGTCGGTAPRQSTGTFNRLVPVAQPVGDAFVTPHAIQIPWDFTYDGMLQPGELGTLAIQLLNAGPVPIQGATAALNAPAADLSSDGLTNPVGLEIGCGAVPFGTILETPPAANCIAPPVRPASNSSLIPVWVPWNHPGGTSHPVSLTVNGTVDGAPFTQEVPLSIGIADWCKYSDHARDFDSLYGLKYPMARLVPVGNAPRFPSHSFDAGDRRLMRLRVKCGFRSLGDSEVDAPQIVALTEETRGAIDVSTLFDEGANSYTTLFRWDNPFRADPEDRIEEGEDDFVEPVEEGSEGFHDDNYWVYKLRTTNLGTGRFTITIRIAGQKDYVTGFVLD